MASFQEKITVDGSEMDLYASVPGSGAGFTAPYPAVVVAQHGGGVDQFIRTICDRLAGEGYAAVAPNLYHRIPDAVMNAPERPRPWDVLSDPDIVADINATVDWLRNHDAVSDRIGGDRVLYGRARGVAGGGQQPPTSARWHPTTEAICW